MRKVIKYETNIISKSHYLNKLYKHQSKMDSKRKISIIGLGYVGLPLAVQFSKKYHVVGYDTDVNRILELKKGIDKTNELTNQDLKDLDNVNITSDKKNIVDSNIYIITVPTPVDKDNKPNLNPLIRASEMVGGYLSKNNIVVYSYTQYTYRLN